MTGGAGTITVGYDYYDPQASPCGENADAGEQVAIGWVEPLAPSTKWRLRRWFGAHITDL